MGLREVQSTHCMSGTPSDNGKLRATQTAESEPIEE